MVWKKEKKQFKHYICLPKSKIWHLYWLKRKWVGIVGKYLSIILFTFITGRI